MENILIGLMLLGYVALVVGLAAWRGSRDERKR